jgi:ferredoxin
MYLDAAAATESRCFPVFVFDPSRGRSLAERIHIHDNPQTERDWPTESFSYKTAAGAETAIDLSFTPADFLFCDGRLTTHFWCVPPERWHKDMIPIGEYAELGAGEAATRIPYVLTVDDNGRLGRAAMTRAVVAAVSMWQSFWRQLQESGGVNNSFALNLLAEESKRLADEKRREVEEIEKNYVAQIDQDIGELTKQIIQRIAGRLVTDSDAGPDTATRHIELPTTPIKEQIAEPAPAADESAAEVEEREEEEISAFDDPYINTPLCTTCNECTQLNAQVFAYNSNKQAYIKDPAGGPYRDIVRAAELCPVRIIHPGKPKRSDEPDIDQWIERAAPFM